MEVKNCVSCQRTESTKWRSGPTCNTCYAQSWRKTEAGKQNTRRTVEKRKTDVAWKVYSAKYIKEYRKLNPRKGDHLLPGNRYSVLKTKARNKGWEVNLTREEYYVLLSKSCHYCGGALPKSGVGLDRTDTTKGYLAGNVVPCCYTCNRFKNNLLTQTETEQVIALLRTLRGGKLWQP